MPRSAGGKYINKIVILKDNFGEVPVNSKLLYLCLGSIIVLE